MCGQVLFWRRRDNVLGYFQGGFFFASVLVPVIGTSVIDSYEPDLVNLYASILLVGAAAYLLGLCCGASMGLRAKRPNVTFGRQITELPNKLLRHSRQAALLAVVVLLGSFALLGYVPFLASDRLSAKYGVGPYQAGFARGAIIYNIAIALSSSIIAVMLAVVVIRRRRRDLVLLIVLAVGLMLTLSRGQALAGPLTFLVAWGIQRRWRPWHLLALVCLAFVVSAYINELAFVAAPVASPSFSSRVASTAPDISDQLGFLRGFQLTGGQHIGTRTIRAGYSLTKGYWDPSDYALRTSSGLSDVSDLAAGGLRLPAAIWGYASYGFVGVAAWSFVSGVFIGWGTTLLRRLLAPVEGARKQSLNLVLAALFFNGTFGILSTFYFPQRSNLMLFGLAMALGVSGPVRSRIDRAGVSPSSASPKAAADSHPGL